MKRRLLVILINLLCAQVLAAQTENPQAQPAPASASTQSAAAPAASEADNLSQQVVNLYRQGKFEAALPLAERALEIRGKSVPDADLRMQAELANLAELYIALKQFKEAEPLYRRILVVQEGAAKPNRARIAAVLDRLALISFGRGNSSAAEELYQRALAVREEAFGKESPQAALALYQLAEFYRYRNQFGKAEPLYRQAIEIEDTMSEAEAPKLSKAEESKKSKPLIGLTCLLSESNQSDKLKALTEERNRRKKMMSEGTNGVGGAAETPPAAGGVLNGRALSLPAPSYPREAKLRGYGGVVIVSVMIDEEGKVIKAEDLCGAVKLLADAAIEAALKARFTPTLLSGRPVKVTGTITYKFVLGPRPR